MAIAINGAGTITGINAGGLPDGCIQAADFASGVGGKLLQTIMVEKTDTYSATGGFTLITGLTVTITPSATSSKIFISGMVQMSGTGTYGMHIRLMRDSTPINIGDAAGSRQQSTAKGRVESGTNVQARPLSFVDEPESDVQLVYSVQAFAESGGTFYCNFSQNDLDAAGYGRYPSQIIVQEIGA